MKLISFPIAIMVILTIFNVTLSILSPSSDQQFDTISGELEEAGESTLITIPDTERKADIEMISITGVFVLISIGFAVAIVAGIQVIGTGLNETSQTLIFKSIFFLGIWGLLTALSAPSIRDFPTFGVLLWLLLTTFYTVGVGIHVLGGTNV